MRNRLETLLAHSIGSKQDASAPSEPFAQVPLIFYKDLSADQFSAMQQIYREAYAKAVQQQQDQHDDFDLNLGDGI